MGNPVDEYIESVTPAEKQAGLGDYARVAMHSAREMLGPRQVGRLGMEVGMVAGASALLGAAGKAVAAATKSSDFKKMLNVNPDLVQMQRSRMRRLCGCRPRHHNDFDQKYRIGYRNVASVYRS